MKRIISAFVGLAGLAALSASAQDYTLYPPRATEISVSYGAVPAMGHIDSYNGGWNNVKPWGSVSFTVDHRFGPVWVGMSYTYSSASGDHVVRQGDGDLTWHGLMVNARYEWLRRRNVRFYSHVGVGCLITYFSPSWEDSYNRTRAAFQAMPLGVQYDFCRNAGLFAEVGYGIQGIAKFGVRVGL